MDIITIKILKLHFTKQTNENFNIDQTFIKHYLGNHQLNSVFPKNSIKRQQKNFNLLNKTLIIYSVQNGILFNNVQFAIIVIISQLICKNVVSLI